MEMKFVTQAIMLATSLTRFARCWTQGRQSCLKGVGGFVVLSRPALRGDVIGRTRNARRALMGRLQGLTMQEKCYVPALMRIVSMAGCTFTFVNLVGHGPEYASFS